MIYTDDKRVYTGEVGLVREEQPLAARLEDLLGKLNRCLHVLEELRTGPTPEKLNPVDRPMGGVLTLGAECQKTAAALETRIQELAHQLGRL